MMHLLSFWAGVTKEHLLDIDPFICHWKFSVGIWCSDYKDYVNPVTEDISICASAAIKPKGKFAANMLAMSVPVASIFDFPF